MGTDDHMESATARTDISVKVTHGRMTKRTTFKVAELTYDALRDWVNASFAFPSPLLAPSTAGTAAPGGPVTRLVYVDPEGDHVTISTTEELGEAVRLMSADVDVLALHLSFPRPRERWHRHMMGAGAFPGFDNAPGSAEANEEAGDAPAAPGFGGAHPFGFGGRCGRGGFGFRGFGGRHHHPDMENAEGWEERCAARRARCEARRAAAAAADANTDAPANFDDEEAAEMPEHFGRGFGRRHHHHHGFGGPHGPHGPHGFGGPREFGRGGHHGFGRHGPHGPHHSFGGPQRPDFAGPHHAGPHHAAPHHAPGAHFFGSFHPGAMPPFPQYHEMNAPFAQANFCPRGRAAPLHRAEDATTEAVDAVPRGHGREHHHGRHGFGLFGFGGRDALRHGDREHADRRTLRMLTIICGLALAALVLEFYHKHIGIYFMAAVVVVAFWARRSHRKVIKHTRRAAKRAARCAAFREKHGHPTPAAEETSPAATPSAPVAEPESAFDLFDLFGRHHRRHHHQRRCARDLSGDDADIESTDSNPSSSATAATSAPVTEPKCRRGGRHGGPRCRRFGAESEPVSVPTTVAPSASPAAAPAPAPAAATSCAFIEPNGAAVAAVAPEQAPMEQFLPWARHVPHHPFGHHGFGAFGAHPHPPHPQGPHGHHHGRHHGGRHFVDGDEADESSSGEFDEFIRAGLATLQEMGFADRRKNRKLLKRLGSVNAVASFLGSRPSSPEDSSNPKSSEL